MGYNLRSNEIRLWFFLPPFSQILNWWAWDLNDQESMKQNKKQRKSCWCFFGRNQLFVEHASQVARFTAEKRAQLNKRLIVKNQLFARHLCVCLSIWCFLSTYVFLLQESVVCYSVSMYPMLLGEESTAVLFLARSQLFVVLVCFIRNRLFGQHLLFVRKQLFYWASVSFVRNQLFVEHVSRVARYAAEKYGVQPIIWDDMLRERPSFHFSKRLFILCISTSFTKCLSRRWNWDYPTPLPQASV